MPGGNNHRPLKHLTADDLRPLWSRLDIPTEKVAAALGVTTGRIGHRRVLLNLPARTRGRGGKNHGGWKETISASRFYEMEMARLMNEVAQ